MLSPRHDIAFARMCVLISGSHGFISISMLAIYPLSMSERHECRLGANISLGHRSCRRDSLLVLRPAESAVPFFFPFSSALRVGVASRQILAPALARSSGLSQLFGGAGALASQQISPCLLTLISTAVSCFAGGRPRFFGAAFGCIDFKFFRILDESSIKDGAQQ